MRLILAALIAGLATGPGAQTQEAFARAFLSKVQPLSFREGREHCGFIGRTANGGFASTVPVAGTATSCASDLPRGMDVVASWHTHGPGLPGYHSELPSEADLRSDAGLGIDGWIATPAGRLWSVDTGARMVRQACGPGCLPAAPGHDAGGDVAKAYGFAALRARLRRARVRRCAWPPGGPRPHAR